MTSHTYIVDVFRETVLSVTGLVSYKATPNFLSSTDGAAVWCSSCVLIKDPNQLCTVVLKFILQIQILIIEANKMHYFSTLFW